MKKSIIGLCVLLVLASSSCKKDELMEPFPQTSIIDSFSFATPDRVLNQVRALYTNLKSGQFYGGRYLLYNDIRGDEFLNMLTNGVTMYTTWNFTLGNTAQEVTGLWSQGYYVINTVNVFLEGLETKGKSVVGDSLANDYGAEARLIRGLVYYSLLQLYARPYWDGNGSKPGLPIRLTGNKSLQDYDLARSTVAQTYQQVLDDLNYAEQNLPLKYSSATLNTTRAHRNTAIALKTRVYLSMQRYEDVITEANKIVTVAAPYSATTGVANALVSDITTVFKTPWTTVESVFSMPMASNEAPGTQNQLAYYYSPTSGLGGVGNGEYSLNPSGIIADATWLPADKRRSFVLETGTTTKRYWLTKYAVASPYTDFVPVMRYAEVLLNLSEAITRSTQTVDSRAVSLLNTVRQRSDAGTTFAPATWEDLAGLIIQERRIEFLGEGRRSPDLLRLGLTIPGKGAVSAIPATDIKYIWPISASELLLNDLMEDNL
ncbi:MAG: RagB/SusD family nutrient uptake outer membrane protein [Candidatus Pseudobacter hemicellulosilyticus]|uniref:RagB/SusD family nutrient uptake outer membrane protein n=1 Tax=Candidatus Pseudobacter hemicellulosilyticus TaxID=3121375 RepID=A0AAJ6BH31_9BACT|nr:MAG: RagB/SusD family nutrient uptake outer membrane protein [Pseudobacter sp.]